MTKGEKAEGDDDEEEEEGEREGVDFEYEPCDARLSVRVAGLYAEVESPTAQVSRLRRTASREAAERYAGVLRAVLEEDEKKKKEFGDGDEDGGLLRLDEVREGWEEDVAALYERGVEELRRLGGFGGGGGDREESGSGSLTETVGRVQRAKVVTLELE